MVVEAYTQMLQGFEHFAPEEKEPKKPPFFKQISLKDFSLVTEVMHVGVHDVEKNLDAFPQLYQPTEAQAWGAIRGENGHSIHHIATKQVLTALKNSRDNLPAPGALYDAIETEWEDWRTGSLEFFKQPARSKTAKVDGEITADRIMTMWLHDEITSFGRKVIDAHRKYLGDIIRFDQEGTELPYNETNPKDELMVETPVNGINFVLSDDLGIQVSVRPDYVLDRKTIIDCKYSRTDPESDIVKANAYLYCLAVKAHLQCPDKRTFDLRGEGKNRSKFRGAVEISSEDMSFFLKVFNGIDYEYARVEFDDRKILEETIMPLANAWKAHNETFRRIKKLREQGFRMPEANVRNGSHVPIQPRLLTTF